MKMRANIGLISGILLLASAFAHAFLGWPPLREALLAINADTNLIGALAAGWHFGSAAMLAFGAITLHASYKVFQGKSVTLFPSVTISCSYILFGIAAFVYRDFNPHFLGFVGLGVPLGLFAFTKAKRKDGTE